MQSKPVAQILFQVSHDRCYSGLFVCGLPDSFARRTRALSSFFCTLLTSPCVHIGLHGVRELVQRKLPLRGRQLQPSRLLVDVAQVIVHRRIVGSARDGALQIVFRLRYCPSRK